MSRIGLKEIVLPEGVTVEVAENNVVTVKGPKGTLTREFKSNVSFKVEGNKVNVSRIDDTKVSKQLHGTSRALLNGMVVGVSAGYTKNLTLTGIGYKAQMMGSNLVLNVGFSHQITVKPVDGIKIEVPSATEVVVSGIDKQMVGQVAANIRALKKPEPYGGKGISYKGERIRRKEGKKAGKK
jgi:large subunit ribosomal protein L6